MQLIGERQDTADDTIVRNTRRDGVSDTNHLVPCLLGIADDDEHLQTTKNDPSADFGYGFLCGHATLLVGFPRPKGPHALRKRGAELTWSGISTA